ncbi:eCIS core domain-containing protein [Pseudarthrobacter sp. YS3]|uniref:eCIS core domain-containing protein n=1 Tax=Pseudarthrobacter sp. YS3 TaxID=3453718 RepID=UPI003EE8CEB2
MTGPRPTHERRTLAPEGLGRSQAVPAVRRASAAGAGIPLGTGVRAFMQGRFDHDFSAVRVHPSALPPATPGGQVPLAWTLGHDVYLGPRAGSTDTPEGLALVAHELAHVVQQGDARDDDCGCHDLTTEVRAENEARATSTDVFDPSVRVVRPAERHGGVGFSTAWAVLGGLAGAVVGGLVGALAGPLGAIVGLAAGAALGAWVAGSLTNTGRGAGEGTARQRIHQLLGRTLTDWVVTDEDAAAALGILLALEKSDPVELYEVVQAMKMGDDWQTLRAELPGDLQASYYALIQLRMSPDSGYVMPGDVLRLTFLSSRGVPNTVTSPTGESVTDPRDVRELEVVDRAVGLFDLGTRIDAAGLTLEAAAGKIAQAYVDARWFSQLSVTLEPVRRGSLYTSLGTLSNPTKAPGASRPLDPVEQARKTKLERFRDHVPWTNFGMPVLDMAVSLYHREVDERLDQYDDPEQLWQQSKARAQTRYEQLTKPTPTQEFLAFSRRQMARTATMPAPERATYEKTNNRFVAWLSKHEKDPKLATTSPVDVWTREYMVVVRGEVAFQVKKEMDSEAQKRRDVALERGSEKFGEALKLAERRIWPVTPTTSASSSEEFISETSGEVVTKSWLITASPAERVMRDKIATDFLHSSMERLVREPEAYLKTDVTTDLADYLMHNPEQLAALQLTVEHPVVESFEDEVDIPAWQTAEEVVVGFIPFVGAAVGIIEALSGRDLHGHPLSTTERTIVGLGAALPGIFKTLKLGKEAFVASKVVKAYGLEGAEAARVYRMYTGLEPGSTGAKLFGWGLDEIKAGRRVDNPKVLREMEGVLKELGMTDKAAAKALMPGAEREIEAAAARELQAVTLSTGPMSPDTEKLLMGNDALRGALKENSLAAKVLKKCASPCFPENATAGQVQRLETLLKRVAKTGDYDENLLREYLYKRRELLDSAIYDLGAIANTKRIQAGTAAKDLNTWLAFITDPTKAITKLDDPLVKLARRNLAHDIGVLGGRAQAAKDGLKVTAFESPFKMGSHGQGLDDVAVQAAEGIEGIAVKGPSLETDLIYVLEHKGGEAGLRKGQMEIDWIVTNIQRLYREGGPEGRKWAGTLAKALDEGRLRGRAYSTEVVKDAAGATMVIQDWIYKARKVLLVP